MKLREKKNRAKYFLDLERRKIFSEKKERKRTKKERREGRKKEGRKERSSLTIFEKYKTSALQIKIKRQTAKYGETSAKYVSEHWSCYMKSPYKSIRKI